MARAQVDFYSESLQVGVSVDVVIPETSGGIGVETTMRETPPVLYLLHGLSDDHTIWLRRTSVERYAAEYGLALVIPAVNRSFYTDMVDGPDYWTYVAEELPAVMHRMFRLGKDRSDTFVAGLSMGGYGAAKLGLSLPDRFASIGCFSGAMDMRFQNPPDDAGEPDEFDARFMKEMEWVYGDIQNIAGSQNDTFALAEQVTTGESPRPDLYIACGTEDFLYEENQRFHAHLNELGYAHEYRAEPGTHEWGFWDKHVRLYLEWLAEKGHLPG